jgi:hypothetical protein
MEYCSSLARNFHFLVSAFVLECHVERAF